MEMKKMMMKLVVLLFSLCLVASRNGRGVAGFALISWPESSLSSRHHARPLSTSSSEPITTTRIKRTMMNAIGNNNDNVEKNDSDSRTSTTSSRHLLADSSRLSHVMLKVTSVDDAVAYWTDKGGTVLASSPQEEQSNDDESASSAAPSSLKSAFVAMGNGKSKPTMQDSFCLELVQTDKYKLGNILNYIGISLLLQYQDNLESLIAGSAGNKKEQQPPPLPEPHGIPIKSCASSPGDFICRLCFKTNQLEPTRAFYENVLGMQVAAADESQLCVRYEPSTKTNKKTSSSSSSGDKNGGNSNAASSPYGVPTALVFEGSNERLDQGNCMDHLAIRTTVSISQFFEQFQTMNALTSDETSTTTATKTVSPKVFMNPTEMFGTTVMGIMDPNGYKIVLAGPP